MTPSAFAASPQGSLQWVVVVAFLPAAAALLLWAERRWVFRRREAWSRRERLEILARERRYFRRGPFDLMAQYQVFKLLVLDEAGVERRGWVRLGGHFNAWSDEAEARWDPP